VQQLAQIGEGLPRDVWLRLETHSAASNRIEHPYWHFAVIALAVVLVQLTAKGALASRPLAMHYYVFPE
jgi:hypothetical protein